mmetsp:Transcript_42299/g.83053  ORF Transcript_42299/g.83053 Transcript_42299/m.83053 type:complete len:97 (+) Transcript_42299:503-793(+)
MCRCFATDHTKHFVPTRIQWKKLRRRIEAADGDAETPTVIFVFARHCYDGARGAFGFEVDSVSVVKHADIDGSICDLASIIANKWLKNDTGYRPIT